MEPGLNDLDNRVAENVGRLISSDQGDLRQSALSRGSFARLERRLVTHHRRTRVAQAFVGVGALFLVAGVGYRAHTHWLARGEGPLTFKVGNGPALEQAAPIDGPADAATTDVTFSDGTRIRMEARARGRVVALDRLGARVELERGRAHVDVHHRDKAEWWFQAGPFEVRVTGTAFWLGWDPATAHFDLHMENGVVSVAGPISGGEMILRAGETLSVGLRDGAAGATVAKVNGATTDAVTPTPPPAVVDNGAASMLGNRRAGGPVSRRHEGTRLGLNWPEELANGHASGVVADARHRGLARVLKSVSSEDLAALADAARYVGRDDLARQALLAQRSRFSGSPRAAQASFLLGRLEDESMGHSGRALAWYDRYLAEAPNGSYVSEALGRKMMVLEDTHRRDQAVSIASDYLRRFPGGSYAHAARALVHTASPPAEAPPTRP